MLFNPIQSKVCLVGSASLLRPSVRACTRQHTSFESTWIVLSINVRNARGPGAQLTPSRGAALKGSRSAFACRAFSRQPEAGSHLTSHLYCSTIGLDWIK